MALGLEPAGPVSRSALARMEDRAAQGTGRATAILGVAMVGWMFVMLALASISGLTGAGADAEPASLGRGVTVTPAPGWSSAADVWEVGTNQVAYRRAGVIAAFAADAFGGGPDDLLAQQLDELERQFSSLQTLPPAPVTVAGGLPALRVLFTGVSSSGDLEGQVVAAADGGTGVVMLAVAPFGQFRRVQDEVDEMLASMVVPR